MISKELIKQILLEQREKIKKSEKEKLVLREKIGEIKKLTKLPHSIIITGIRRCGKSTFLSQIINNYYNNCYYINFEDERLADFRLQDFNILYEILIELFGKTNTFFLDEIQNILGWEKWVRRMCDNNFKFYITGSNARLLSKELATLLTGRHLQISLFPFSFREFLSFHTLDITKESIYLTEKRAFIKKHLSEYLRDGGFPEYIKYKEIQILQEYFNDIIQRDIVERYKIKHIKQLKELARFLITNTGNLTTYNQLKKISEIKSVNTIINYVSYLETAYLLIKVPYFSYSLKKQTANPFKIYAIDIGLRNAIGFTFSKDVGRIYETLVTIELKRKNKEIYYWKNQQHEEVDFVIKSKNKIEQLIQVCFDINDNTAKKRELRALIKASKELRCNDLLIITEEKEGEEKHLNKKIKYIPLWKWLL